MELNENEFEPELLQNAANELEKITPEEFKNLLEQLPPTRPARPKRERTKRAQRQQDRQDFECANLALYNRCEFEGRELGTGRRYICWRWTEGLEEDLTPKFMEKIERRVHSSFYIRHIYSYWLRNIEDNTRIEYFQNHSSPWLNRKSDAENWLKQQEKLRFGG